MEYISAIWSDFDERVNAMLSISKTPEFQKWKMIMECYSDNERHTILFRVTEAYLNAKVFYQTYPTAWKAKKLEDVVKEQVSNVWLYKHLS